MIQTITGSVSAGAQGITLMHEHIFMDLRHKFSGTGLHQEDRPVTRENAAMLRQNHRLLRDNLYLGDEQTAREELARFVQAGGKTIVEMSCHGMGTNLEALVRISKEMGIYIVKGTGLYTQATFPAWAETMSRETMAALYIHDLTEGIGETGIRAGILGEIGTSAEITPGEWNSLSAAACAQKATGAAISVHIDPWKENGVEVARFLEKQGANLTRVVIGHTDCVLNKAYLHALLRMGCVVELDNFGKRYGTPGLHFDTDEQRIACVCDLIAEGWERQIVFSTDICLKTDLHQYGGGGYGHIPQSILPALRKAGISDEAIRCIMVDTPARILDSLAS